MSKPWGRVIRVDYGACTVALDSVTLNVKTSEPIAVGDWVLLSDGAEPRIQEIQTRSTQMTRRDNAGFLQVLAANIDLVLIAIPADRLNFARAEREVAIGWDSGATPIALLTKADLDDGTNASELSQRLLGVEVIPVSVDAEDTLTALREMLIDRTSVLLGPSGAGKSTLVNALLGEKVEEVGEVREADHRGRHTTTTRQLHALKSGGFLIDTPGLRSLSLAVDEDALNSTFPEIAQLAGDCRFRDCSHEHEPDCAVLNAVEIGELSSARLENYRKMARDLAYQLRRDDPIAAQAHEAIWRQRRIEGRRINRERGRNT